ncbi:MAG: TonB-dependent receptor [Blastocatellia bacterium]|nr:TonB-dependent receptor [Blastocatellia bacterium]
MSYIKNVLKLLGVLLCTMFLATAASAQTGATTASISGLVSDEQKAAISGAKVIAKNVNTNFTAETTSNAEGKFSFLQVSPGIYELEISSDGFNTKKLRFELNLGSTALLEPTLTAGSVGEVVVIETDALFDKLKTENSTSVNRDRIDNLPINQRNFLAFSLTAPRVVVDRRPGQGTTGSSGLSFNAQSGRGNNLTIDGVDNNETFSGAVRQTFTQEAVSEFQVVSDSYSAEFGRAIGGVVNIVTRGGGNKLHGRLFSFIRDESFSARQPFATTRPEFKQYQFGAALSGPIKQDKSFFFTSFERFSLKQNNIVTIGDDIVASANRLGFGLRNGPIPFSSGITSVLGRADFQTSQNNKFFVRYTYGGTYNGQFEPFGALTGQTTASILRLNDNSIAANNTYTSSSLGFVNETRFLYNRRDQDVLPNDGGAGNPLIQIIQPQGSALFGRNTSLPQLRDEDLIQIVNNVSLPRGDHQLKFGIDFAYRRVSSDSEQPFFPTGFGLFVPLSFGPGAPVISPLQSFDPSLRTPDQRAFLTQLANIFGQVVPGFPQGVPLANLPLPAQFIQSFGGRRLDPGLTVKSFSGFFQDDINLASNLVVKLGVRYDINRVKFQPDNNGNFAPRIAIAYSPIENLSVRAGYGIFFGGPITGVSFPVQLSVSRSLTNVVIPFPFSVLSFGQPGNRFPESTQLPPALANLPPQFSLEFQYDPNFRNSYTQQATFGVDYKIGANTIIAANYNYVRGIKLLSERNINPIVRPLPNDPGLLQSGIIGRVDPTRGNVNEIGTFTDSYFHSGTFSIGHRILNRLDLRAHYTLSKAIDNIIDFRTDIVDAPNNPLRPDLERGLSLLDVRHRFVLSGTFSSAGLKNPFLRNFQISTITSFESGKPFNLIAGADLNNDGVAPPGDRPLGIARNAGITPDFANVDLRIARAFPVAENVKLEGLIEFFNLFNRTNISDLNRVFAPDLNGNFNLPALDDGRFSAPANRFTGAFPPRRIQLAVRLTF